MILHQAIRYGEELLRDAGIADAQWNAERLLLKTLGIGRAEVYANLQRELTDVQGSAYRALLVRRAQHEPLAYIEGTQEFYGREFHVDRSVLIPRPETEEVVRAALALTLPAKPGILDLGAGSGCIAATLALEIRGARVTALELSRAAIRVLRSNSHGEVKIVRGDLFSPPFLPASFDLLVSNPPYVEEKDYESLPAETRHEPREALVPASLKAVFLSLLQTAKLFLKPGGFMIFEIGAGQDSVVDELLKKQTGISKIGSRSDFRGILRTFILQNTCTSSMISSSRSNETQSS
ncbi:MAG TPA: peptide chain release factor N(5)-glutamine methyltransferase [Acidobacteriota bacterium]|nr:peptide chain release factor N(5)-glutamine methyltransferase [Acidobacteriota bacterium]